MVKKLLIITLIVGFIFGYRAESEENSPSNVVAAPPNTLPNTFPNAATNTPPGGVTSPSDNKKPPTKAKTLLKSFFSPEESVQKGEGERLKKRVIEKSAIDTDQLQVIMDKFPDNDKNILGAIKTQIATWPPEIFEEISSYREFVINARKIAQQKYESLSQEAKMALETEKKLKSQLTEDTTRGLEALDVTASRQ